jgi:hypothetical protein
MTLTRFPDAVSGPFSIDDFCQFVSALEDEQVQITNANFGSLCLLCDEFGFFGFSERLSACRQSAVSEEVVMDDSEVQLNLSLQSKLVRHSQAQKSTAVVLLPWAEAFGVQVQSGTGIAFPLGTELGRVAANLRAIQRETTQL